MYVLLFVDCRQKTLLFIINYNTLPQVLLYGNYSTVLCTYGAFRKEYSPSIMYVPVQFVQIYIQSASICLIGFLTRNKIIWTCYIQGKQDIRTKPLSSSNHYFWTIIYCHCSIVGNPGFSLMKPIKIQFPTIVFFFNILWKRWYHSIW